MDGTLKGTDSWFLSPKSQVSAHYGIGKDGEIHQYVKEDMVAWANGRVQKPTWPLIATGPNPNLYTLSIEHEGKPGETFTDAMYDSTTWLIREMSQRWGIPLDREHIIGHCEIFAAKPNCPGNGLDWSGLLSKLKVT